MVQTARLGGGRITRKFFDASLGAEMKRLKEEAGAEAFSGGRFREAIALFKTMSTSRSFETFLTVPAYRKIV